MLKNVYSLGPRSYVNSDMTKCRLTTVELRCVIATNNYEVKNHSRVVGV